MVSRRTIITLPVAVTAAGLATGTALATATGADSGAVVGRAVPRTIARQRSIVGGRLHARLDDRLTHLAVSWSGPGVTVSTRSASGWTAWTTPAGCPGGPDTAVGRHSALLVVPGTTEYQVVLDGDGAAGSITELNTLDGPVVTTAAEPLAALPLPDGTNCPVTYLPRSAWGADESLRFSGATEVWPADYAVTQTLTVHHTAGANDDPDPAATVRAIYYYQSVTLGWGDIGYQLFIDEQGRVYEGRWSGADPVPAFDAVVPAGTAPRMVTAGHVGGYNTGNFGVCLLGLFTSQGPTAAAYDALVAVLASLARACQIDPELVVNYVGPTGATRTVLGVSGHRDWAATECPGNTFYPTFPTLRSEVAELSANPVSPSPTAAPTPSPTTSPTPTGSPTTWPTATPSATPTPTPTPTRRKGPKPRP